MQRRWLLLAELDPGTMKGLGMQRCKAAPASSAAAIETTPSGAHRLVGTLVLDTPP
jgi:hypothetical protein